jgi:hypothetical protein
MYKELETKKRKLMDLQDDIKNKENLLASQGVLIIGDICDINMGNRR